MQVNAKNLDAMNVSGFEIFAAKNLKILVRNGTLIIAPALALKICQNNSFFLCRGQEIGRSHSETQLLKWTILTSYDMSGGSYGEICFWPYEFIREAGFNGMGDCLWVQGYVGLTQPSIECALWACFWINQMSHLSFLSISHQNCNRILNMKHMSTNI